jgi:UDP-glucose 4-epimerase
MKTKIAVVTGGAGFIGSNLVDGLLERGYCIGIVDNLSTGRLEDIEHAVTNEQVTFHRGDIKQLDFLKEVFKDTDYVFHQAALPSVPRSIDDPLKTHDVNSTGTLNVLLAARDCNVKKVVYASSSSVYGDTEVLPKNENMIPNPLSPYAVTKLVGEYYCTVFQRTYGLPTVCLRYFNVYGPRQDPNSQYAAVIPRFIDYVSRDKSPVIFGDGLQTRDFTFVYDVVKANILAAESNASGIYNIGRGENNTITHLAELVIKIFGKKLDPVCEDERSGDVKHSLADISRAAGFGYNPEYSLEQGLKITIREYADVSQ